MKGRQRKQSNVQRQLERKRSQGAIVDMSAIINAQKYAQKWAGQTTALKEAHGGESKSNPQSPSCRADAEQGGGKKLAPWQKKRQEMGLAKKVSELQTQPHTHLRRRHPLCTLSPAFLASRLPHLPPSSSPRIPAALRFPLRPFTS